jgi:hypothetical protein
MPQTWTVELLEDPDTKDLLLPFPEDMLKLLDWEEGTVVYWEITTDNKIMLKKKVDDDADSHSQ